MKHYGRFVYDGHWDKDLDGHLWFIVSEDFEVAGVKYKKGCAYVWNEEKLWLKATEQELRKCLKVVWCSGTEKDILIYADSIGKGAGK